MSKEYARKVMIELDEGTFTRLNRILVFGQKRAILEKLTRDFISCVEAAEHEDELVTTKYLKGMYSIALRRK